MYNALVLLSAVNPVSPSDDWGLVFSTVMTGISVVFIILILLIIFIWLMGLLFSRGEKKKSLPESKPAELPPVNVFKAEKPAFEGINTEVVAAIAAAVTALGENDGKIYTVKNIKKKEKALRSGWGNAGIAENMRPFVR